MKYIVLFALSAICFSCSSTSEKETNNQIKESSHSPADIVIQVEGYTKGLVNLIGMFETQNHRVDSAQITKPGEVRFRNEEGYKPGFYYVILPDRTTLQLLLDTDQQFSLKTIKGDLIPAAEVDGSIDNELLYKNLKFQTSIQPQFNHIVAKINEYPPGSEDYNVWKGKQEKLDLRLQDHLNEIFTEHPNSFFTSFKKAGQNPKAKDIRKPDGTLDNRLRVYLYKKEFWDGVDFSDERLLYTPVIHNKLKRYMTALTVQHQDSIISAADYLVNKVLDYPAYFKFFTNWIVLEYEPGKTKLMDGEAVFVHMIQKYFTFDRVFWSDSTLVYGLRQRANEMAASLVGKKGPDVVAKNPQGLSRSIYEIKAPYIIVYMFNPTCEHCQEQTPKLVEFYRQWKPKGVEVFGIAIETNDEEWKQYLNENHMNWVNVHDPTNRAIYAKYYVDNTPEIYVLNPDRTIIAKNLNVSQIEEVIRRDQT